MTRRDGLRVRRCVACGWAGYPDRLWCPRCGSDRFRTVLVRTGRVEETTSLHAAVGRRVGAAVSLGAIRLANGARAIARLEGEARPGDVVSLADEDGVPVARPRRPRTRG